MPPIEVEPDPDERVSAYFGNSGDTVFTLPAILTLLLVEASDRFASSVTLPPKLWTPVVVTLSVKLVVWAVLVPGTPVIVRLPTAVVAPTVLPKVTLPLPLVIVSDSVPRVPLTVELNVTAALVLVLLAFKVLSVVFAAIVTAPE